MAVNLNGQKQAMTWEDYQVMSTEKKLAKAVNDLHREQSKNHKNIAVIAEKQREIEILQTDLARHRADADQAHERNRRLEESNRKSEESCRYFQESSRHFEESSQRSHEVATIALRKAALAEYQVKTLKGAAVGAGSAGAGVLLVHTLITPVTVPVALAAVLIGGCAGATIANDSRNQ